MFDSLMPLSTPIGSRIEKATSESLGSEDWRLILEITDLINTSENGPDHAIKAISKRLNTKHPNVVQHTLILLEACVKNCDSRFHLKVANEAFLKDWVKLFHPKSLITPANRAKSLELLQNWADAFNNQLELSAVKIMVKKLRDEGVEFPAQDLDAMSPIYTPTASSQSTRNVTHSNTTNRNALNNGSASANASFRNDYNDMDTFTASSPSLPPQTQNPSSSSSHRAPPRPAQQSQSPIMSYRFDLTAEQISKLRNDLLVVKESLSLFNELLANMEPGADASLVQEIHDTCKEMQKRVVSLIDQVQNEPVLMELLKLNEDLNSAFSKYGNLTQRASYARSNQNTTTVNHAPSNTSSNNNVSYVDLDHSLTASMSLQQAQNGNAIQKEDSFQEFVTSSTAKEPFNATTFKSDNLTTNSFIDFESTPLTSSTSSSTRNIGSTYEDNMMSPSHSSLVNAMHSRPTQKAGVSQQSEEDEFNVFATSRATTLARPSQATSNNGLGDFDPFSTPDSNSASQPPVMSQPPPASLSTSDFDDFLAQRGFNSPQNPSNQTPSAPSQPTTLSQQSGKPRRQLDLNEKNDEDIFGL